MSDSRRHRRAGGRKFTVSRQLAKRRRAIRRLFAESLENRILLTTVTGIDPLANSHDAPVSADIVATFDQDINSATATSQTLAVHSMKRGRLVGAAATVSTAGGVVTFDPAADFFPGETVQITATSGIQSMTADPVVPSVWQFRAQNTSGSGQFVDSGQRFPSPFRGQSVVFGDVDGDGDLDSLHGGDLVWLNDGTGVFTDTGQSLFSTGQGDISGYADLVDLDGDGDLDVVGTQRVLFNDGSGVFSDSGQNAFGSNGLEAGDLDGDGDFDVMTGEVYAGNRVWFNNGSGGFADSGQSLGTSYTRSIEFGDLDGDGDLDAFVPNWGAPNRVWMNDGSGVFADSGQTLGGFSASRDVELGDMDGDGDLDAVVAQTGAGAIPTSRVWFNDGTGVFTDSGQGMNPGGTWSLKLGDLDGDSDLDIFLPYFYSNANNSVWINDGAGTFSNSGQLLFPGERWGTSVDLADVDGDGDLDAWATNRFPGGNRLWINQNLTPNVTLSIDNPAIAEAAGEATVTATLSAVHGQAVTVELGLSGTASGTDDFTVSGTQIVIAAGATSGSVTITAVQDTIDEPDETVIVDINAVTNGQEGGAQQVTATILDDDEPIPVPEVTLLVDNAAIPEESGVATFTATLSEVTTVPVTIDLGISGTADASDFVASATQIVVAPGATTGSISVTAVQDDVDEPDETVIVDVSNVTGGTEAGNQQQTTTISDDDLPKLTVTALTTSASGFSAEFSTDLNTSVLNLYDTQSAGLGPADVVLQGASTGPVAGSLVVDPSLREITFIKSGGPLAPDTYTVTLRSAADGFTDVGGQLLDGDGNGTDGDDYTSTFAVAEPPTNAVTIGIRDFVRGPGQDVNLPANELTGIPLTISEGTNVRAVDLRVTFDPTLLTIIGATVGADAPAGASVITNTSTPGLAILVFFSTTPMPAGSGTFVNLLATVPATDPSGIYGVEQVLDVHGVTVSDGNDNEAPVVVDDGLHLASYFADVSGNGRINAADASQVARFAALIDNGFVGSPNADPLIVGDISGNGRLNAADASLLAQFAALIVVPQIPPIPGGIVITWLGSSGERQRATSPQVSRPANRFPQDSAAGDDRGSPQDFGANGNRHGAVDRAITDHTTATDESLFLALEEAIDELSVSTTGIAEKFRP